MWRGLGQGIRREGDARGTCRGSGDRRQGSPSFLGPVTPAPPRILLEAPSGQRWSLHRPGAPVVPTAVRAPGQVP